MLARLLLAHITEVAEPDADRGALPGNSAQLVRVSDLRDVSRDIGAVVAAIHALANRALEHLALDRLPGRHRLGRSAIRDALAEKETSEPGKDQRDDPSAADHVGFGGCIHD